MWTIPTGTSSVLKKKNQVKSPSIWSRVPKTGSDPPIGSDRDSGRDTKSWRMTGSGVPPVILVSPTEKDN